MVSPVWSGISEDPLRIHFRSEVLRPLWKLLKNVLFSPSLTYSQSPFLPLSSSVSLFLCLLHTDADTYLRSYILLVCPPAQKYISPFKAQFFFFSYFKKYQMFWGGFFVTQLLYLTN